MRPARPGEIWRVDLGLTAKVRPCVVLSDAPADDELALVLIVPHTTAIRGNRWEFQANVPYLKNGVFHLQQIQAVPLAKLQERLGVLSEPVFQNMRRAIIALLRLDA